MHINQLKYFVAVAEHRSFSKAAEQYYLTQTGVSQQVQKLEETIGVQLIDRKTRPISLTPMGTVFLREVRAILMKLDHAIQRTREASTGITGALRIGYTNGYEHSDLTANIIKHSNLLLLKPFLFATAVSKIKIHPIQRFSI